MQYLQRVVVIHQPKRFLECQHWRRRLENVTSTPLNLVCRCAAEGSKRRLGRESQRRAQVHKGQVLPPREDKEEEGKLPRRGHLHHNQLHQVWQWLRTPSQLEWTESHKRQPAAATHTHLPCLGIGRQSSHSHLRAVELFSQLWRLYCRQVSAHVTVLPLIATRWLQATCMPRKDRKKVSPFCLFLLLTCPLMWRTWAHSVKHLSFIYVWMLLIPSQCFFMC